MNQPKVIIQIAISEDNKVYLQALTFTALESSEVKQ